MSTQDDIKKAEESLKKKMAKVVRAGAIQTFQNIIVGSPVDSGRFRSNWQASVNTPNMEVVFSYQKTKTDTHGKAIKNQFNRHEDVNANTSDYTLDGVLYLTNNLPYAQRLENGWSQQRGSGWVATEVSNGKQAIIDAIKGIK